MTGARAGRAVPGNRWDLLDGAWPQDPPAVTVVVVHHRQQRALDRTLAALARQTHPAGRTEVVVVDDGSPQPPRVPPGVRLLRQEALGFRAAAARNLGAAQATGDVLAFLDADTAPEPAYLRELTRLPALAPDVVTVGRRRHADLSATGPDVPVEVAGPAAELPAPAWLAQGYAETADLLNADDRSYRFVISAVLACTRALFAEAGGFDERATEYGGEDWEWAHRAWRAGGLLAHVPAAVAWHDGPDWSGRADGDARRGAKNREALRLANAVPVAGSRGHGVRSAGSDVRVVLAAAPSVASAFVCVDALLAALPEAVVGVPAAVATAFAADHRVAAVADGPPPPARLTLTATRPVRADPAALRAAVDRVGAERLGRLELTAPDGTLLVRVDAHRAVARAARWGRDDLFPVRRERADWLHPLPAEPDVEAYLGGWG